MISAKFYQAVSHDRKISSSSWAICSPPLTNLRPPTPTFLHFSIIPSNWEFLYILEKSPADLQLFQVNPNSYDASLGPSLRSWARLRAYHSWPRPSTCARGPISSTHTFKEKRDSTRSMWYCLIELYMSKIILS